MKLHLLVGTGLVLALAAPSFAEDQSGPQASPAGHVRTEVMVANPDQIETIAPDQVDFANPPSRIIYLNRCVGGCTIHPGNESSINQTSAILSQTANLTEFQYPDSEWQQVVSCVRATYAPFNVQITDQDPGNVGHWEAIIAGTAQQAGMTCDNQNGCILGVAAGTNQCPGPVIPNAIVFDFVNTTGWFSNDIHEMCWVASQEIAHAFGLDHEVSAVDPMSYVGLDNGPPYTQHVFQNQGLPCGAASHNDSGCYCPSTDDPQNSYQRIMTLFGASGATPPTVQITDPANGATVTKGFQVHASISDAQGIASATLSIDGGAVQTVTNGNYTFSTPNTLAVGNHTVMVTASNTVGLTGSASVSVSVQQPPACSTASDCANAGDNYTCVGGMCVPGPGAMGGLGDTCGAGADCASGQCASDASGAHYCVEACTVGGSDCPSGFDCVDTGSQGVCWPAQGGGIGGGCLSTGGEAPTLPIGLGIALGALMIKRRRK